MANYAMDAGKAPMAGKDGDERAPMRMPRPILVTCAILLAATIAVAIACAVMAAGPSRAAAQARANADTATNQAQSLRQGGDVTQGQGDASASTDTSDGASKAQTDLVKPALQIASQMADLQNEYATATDDQLTDIANQLGAFLSDDDQDKRVPWYTNQFKDGYSGRWQASSYASGAADGTISLTWLFANDADGQVLAWATADYDGYHVGNVQTGITPTGRKALADNPYIGDDAN